MPCISIKILVGNGEFYRSQGLLQPNKIVV